MYRVMIVDDEEPVLDSFSFILHKEPTGFKLCGKARSGAEAISLIPELNPDLVFMDIQMPGIDGIDTIDQVKRQFPNIIFILATAYERFDIAQKAIPLGIFSYLVKPVSRKALINELEKVKKHLDIVRENNNLRIEQVQALKITREEKKNKFLSDLIWKNPSGPEWLEFRRLFSVNCENGLICILEIKNAIDNEIKSDLYDSIAEKAQYKYKCFCSIFSGRAILFFPEERDLSGLESYLSKLLGDFDKYDFILGVGGLRKYSELNGSFATAFLPFADERRKPLSFAFEQEIIHEICSCFLKSNWRQGRVLFEEYWLDCFSLYEFNVAKSKMVVLFSFLLRDLYASLSNANFPDIVPSEEIMRLESIGHWRQWSARALDLIEEISLERNDHLFPRPLSSAINFIRGNFDKPLQLSSVADECKVSASYLSRLFSEHLDSTFIDYLNRYRLQRAKILLKENDVSIKEISYLVGYQDPNYFSRIFRKYMGVPPSDLIKRTAADEN